MHIVGRQRVLRQLLRPREGIGAVSRELRRGESVEIIEQHVIALVGVGLSVGIEELARTETRARIVRLPIAPIQQPAVIKRHHPLIGLADESFFTLGREESTRALRGIVGSRDQTPDPRNRVVKLRLGQIEITHPQRHDPETIFEQHAVLVRAIGQIGIAINQRIAGARHRAARGRLGQGGTTGERQQQGSGYGEERDDRRAALAARRYGSGVSHEASGTLASAAIASPDYRYAASSSPCFFTSAESSQTISLVRASVRRKL